MIKKLSTLRTYIMERTVQAGVSAGLDLLLTRDYNQLEVKWEKSEPGKTMIVILHPQDGQRFAVYCQHSLQGEPTTCAVAKEGVLTRLRSMTRVSRRRPFVAIRRDDNEIVFLFIPKSDVIDLVGPDRTEFIDEDMMAEDQPAPFDIYKRYRYLKSEVKNGRAPRAYHRRALRTWMATGHNTNPFTGLPLRENNLRWTNM
jgi:hypothetical protein